jgi:hypothetical protein
MQTEAVETLQEPGCKVVEAPQKKHPGGRRPVWNWKGVIVLLKQKKDGEGPFKDNRTFKNKTMFKQFIQKKVQRVGDKDRGDGPDTRTVGRAIPKFNLEQYATFDE